MKDSYLSLLCSRKHCIQKWNNDNNKNIIMIYNNNNYYYYNYNNTVRMILATTLQRWLGINKHECRNKYDTIISIIIKVMVSIVMCNITK